MEVLEPRLLMSATTGQVATPEVEPHAAAAVSGLDSAAASYGFAGEGQTVAIIDTGIAYDHPSLGGGYGPGYRVVGGWDFSDENDADPYDDGPWGARGTHLAATIGADAGPAPGVAPQVDLVALRVFNDHGEGEFESVKNALAWVVEHRDAFEHPITTVAMGISVSQWNDDRLPAWANLEEELAALDAAGIFVAAAAGDHFTAFDQPGLSYPAVSQSVVPVMSHDADGLLSFFSQRDSRAIAAPGRDVQSATPDYAGNQDGIANDYEAYSGTSTAASYLAGASVVVREALQFTGRQDVTPQMIYREIVNGSDTVYDPVTGDSYRRLNLASTLARIIPEDDYGSTVATAHFAGTLAPQQHIELVGVVNGPNDLDYFSFIPKSTGTIRMEAVETTNDLQIAWSVADAPWQYDGQEQDVLVVHVLAGQEVTIGLTTDAGVGHYLIDATAEANDVFGAWVGDNQYRVFNVALDSAGWFSLHAFQDGYLTVEADGNPSNSVALDLFDQDFRQIVTGEGRVDALVSTGDQFLLRVRGVDSNVDFKITNLVAQKDDAALLSGTIGDDVFTFSRRTAGRVVLNGVAYDLPVAGAEVFLIAGYEGNDRIVLAGAGASDIQTSRVERVDDFDAVAFALRNDLRLTNTGAESLNYGGLSEKWLKGADDRWYFITPSGAFYKADNVFAASTQIAQLHPYFYTELERIFEAQPSRFMVEQRAIGIDRERGLFLDAEYFENWGGWGERWMNSDAKDWYFITPAGDLYLWNGADDLNESQQVASLSPAYHADPSLLHQASLRETHLQPKAARLDANLALHAPPSYDQNWGGWDEKWIPSTNDYWYFITPSGGFYRWNRSPSLAGSALVAVLDATYYDNPALLYEAVTPDHELPAAASSEPLGFAELFWLGQALAVNSAAGTEDPHDDRAEQAFAESAEEAVAEEVPIESGQQVASEASRATSNSRTDEEVNWQRRTAVDTFFDELGLGLASSQW